MTSVWRSAYFHVQYGSYVLSTDFSFHTAIQHERRDQGIDHERFYYLVGV